MKIERFTTSFGEQAELRRMDDGRIVCPICGYLYKGSELWMPANFVGGLEHCPECNVQMGNQDIDCVPPDPSDPIMRRWARLRIKWLQRTGWPEDALRQLHQNLGLSRVMLEGEAQSMAITKPA